MTNEGSNKYGLDNQELNGLMHAIKQIYSGKISQLKNQINHFREENKRLEDELTKLRYQSNSVMNVADYKDLIFKKTKDAVVLLNKQKEYEMEQIKQVAEEKLKKKENKIREMTAQIQYQYQLIGEVAQKLENILQKMDNGSSKESIAAKEIKQDVIKSDELKLKEKKVEEIKSDENKPEKLIEIKSEEIKSGKLNEKIEEIKSDEILHEGNSIVTVNEDQFEVLEKKQPHNIEKRNNPAGIKSEIEKIKNRYLIGRIVGEDLLNQNGKVIIQKNQRITQEVIELAQREGLLSQLIMSMEIGDFEE